MPQSRTKYESTYREGQLILGIGGKVGKKDPLLQEFAGYDLDTALKKARLMAIKDLLGLEGLGMTQDDYNLIIQILDYQGKAYFMTEGSTELTKLLVKLGDDRRRLPSAKAQQEHDSDT